MAIDVKKPDDLSTSPNIMLEKLVADYIDLPLNIE